MSLNQLIDSSNTRHRPWLNIKVESANIVNELAFDGDSGADGDIVTNSSGVPVWTKLSPPSFEPGPPNTFLYSGNSAVSWEPLNCQIAVYSPYGQVDGTTEAGAQNIGAPGAPVANEYQISIFSNSHIITHPNDTDFVFQKNGYYKITLQAAVSLDIVGIQFYFILNNNTSDVRYGLMTAPVIQPDGAIERLPGLRQVSGFGCTMTRILNLSQGDIFNVYSDKVYRNLLITDAQYYVGDRNCMISFEFLGNNYSG